MQSYACVIHGALQPKRCIVAAEGLYRVVLSCVIVSMYPALPYAGGAGCQGRPLPGRQEEILALLRHKNQVKFHGTERIEPSIRSCMPGSSARMALPGPPTCRRSQLTRHAVPLFGKYPAKVRHADVIFNIYSTSYSLFMVKLYKIRKDHRSGSLSGNGLLPDKRHALSRCFQRK